MAEANFTNRTVWVGDNLHVMRGINSECVDLIYLDPPFNSNQELCRSDWLDSGRRRLQRHLDAVGY